MRQLAGHIMIFWSKLPLMSSWCWYAQGQATEWQSDKIEKNEKLNETQFVDALTVKFCSFLQGSNKTKKLNFRDPPLVRPGLGNRVAER